jgi:hypothetical protein
MTKQREPQQAVATAEVCTTRRELADVAAFQQDEGRYQRSMPLSQAGHDGGILS